MILDTAEEVPLAQWVERVERERDEGWTWFDSLGAAEAVAPGADGDGAVDVWLTLARPEPGEPGEPVRLVLRTRVPVGQALASVTHLFPGAGFCEREAHEMFGLAVSGFDDGTGLGVRGLLLGPDGPEAPLRKAFPLRARGERDWPGSIEPGESRETATGRRRHHALGVPQREAP